jgi:hypothetical protein
MADSNIANEIQSAIGAHGKWKFNLKMAINNGKSDFTVQKVSCDNLCDFGKWLYSDKIDEQTKLGKPYEVVTRLHAEFHQCASQVLKLALNNQKQQAESLLEGEFTDRSNILVKALNKWKGEVN